MKIHPLIRYLLWILITSCFIMLIQIGSSLEFFLLKDFRIVLILILATLLLMSLAYKKGQSVKVWKSSIQFNLFFVGVIMSSLNLMSIFGRLSQKSELMSIIVASKPLMYCILLYLPLENIFRSIQMRVIVRDAAISDEENNRDKSRLVTVETLELSRREIEVIQLALQDMTNKQISEKLFIQETTVKKHLQNIYKKAQCADRTELIKKVRLK